MQRHTPSKWSLPRTAIIAVIATLVLGLMQALPAGAESPLPCRGEDGTIYGTPGDDVIYGTDGNDVIVGLGGNDIIYGGKGADLICGYEGNDFIDGGPGRDRIYGGPGGDHLIGGTGNDRLYGQQGADELAGTNGRDRLHGGSGHDALLGGLGRDTVWGGRGTDTCQTDTYDRKARSCESADTTSYRVITVTPVGNGTEDPTNSNFGDAYFAGTKVTVFDTRYGIPVSVKTLRGKAPFRIRIPVSAHVELNRQFASGYMAIGSADTGPDATNVTVEMFCCALY